METQCPDKKHTQNGMFNLLKFIFAGFVFLMHAGTLFGTRYFLGGWISVEFFFLFCGFTLSRKAALLAADPMTVSAVGEATFTTLKKRIAKIFPFVLVASVISFLLRHFLLEGFATWKLDAVRLLPEIFMLQMEGFAGYWATGVAWFLSAMWIGIAILFPLMLKGKTLFSKVFAPLIAVLCYGYLQVTTGYLYEPGAFLGLVFKGVIRALGGISLGAAAYEFSEWMKRAAWKRSLVLATEIVGYLALFVLLVFKENADWFALLPFYLMFLVALTGSGLDGLSEKLDNGFTRFLSSISMILYLNHYYVADIIRGRFSFLSTVEKYLLYFAGVAAIVLLTYFGWQLIRFIKKKRAAKEHAAEECAAEGHAAKEH